MLQKANAEQIKLWIEGINAFNSTPGEGITRVLFTKPELEARRYVKQEMEALGLLIHEDNIGNIIGVLEGEDALAPPVWTGSHIDTVNNAGMFDGVAGVCGAMEALRIIKESGIAHKRSLAAVVYTSEEPTRFGLSCLGSRSLAGKLTLEDIRALRDDDGQSLYCLLDGLGYEPDKIGDVARKVGDVYGAVELHIEQNNILDKNGITIGAVKGICAPTNMLVTVSGVQSHAGGTPMGERYDAFAACCEMALLLERAARDSTSEHTTGTVGRVRVFPGAVNVIPGKVQFSVDIRDIDFDSKDRILAQFCDGMDAIAKRRGVRVERVLENHDRPLRCNATLFSWILEACDECGVSSRPLISGAYHDSLFIGEFAPAAMIFVPSKDGISHSGEEWTDYRDIAAGTDVLARVLLRMANHEGSFTDSIINYK